MAPLALLSLSLLSLCSPFLAAALNVGVAPGGGANGLLPPDLLQLDGQSMFEREFQAIYTGPAVTIAEQLNRTRDLYAQAARDAHPMGCGNLTCTSSKDFDFANTQMGHGMAVKYTGDVQVDFVRSMIAHHAGAVDMCYTLLDTTPEPALSYLCREIVYHQVTEIRLMNSWLEINGHAPAACGANGTNADCKPECAADSEGAAVMAMGNHDMVMGCGVTGTTNPAAADFLTLAMKMHNGMAIDYSCATAKDFLRAMIPHHTGAIAMCSVLTQYTEGSIDPFLAALCAEIGFAQRGEVAWQTYYLESHSYAPAVCGATPDYSVARCVSECDGHDHSGHGGHMTATTTSMDHSGHGGHMTTTPAAAGDPSYQKFHAMSHDDLVREAVRLEKAAQAKACTTSGADTAKKSVSAPVSTGVALALGLVAGAMLR